ncbi:hypothetical protein [Lactobacillus phage CV244]|nr:hypothetical protein [Lactobacillus phage CV244]WFD53190.1 hypothetical protein [Lactobacillus phage T280]
MNAAGSNASIEACSTLRAGVGHMRGSISQLALRRKN